MHSDDLFENIPLMSMKLPAVIIILLRLYPCICVLFQYLKVKEKKNLRLSSASINRRLQDHDKTFNNWKFREITPEQLKQLADDVEQIEGEYFI